MLPMKKDNSISLLQAVVAVVSLLIVMGSITSFVAVSLAQGVATDQAHEMRLENLEEADREHQRKAEKRHDEIIKVLYEIKLELKDKEDKTNG